MPYIETKKREYYNEEIKILIDKLKSVGCPTGDITYIIFCIAKGALDAQDMSYTNASRIRAAFHDASDEMYRRYFSEYENKKISENGDI